MNRAWLRPLALVGLAAGTFVLCERHDALRLALAAAWLVATLVLLRVPRKGPLLASWLAALGLWAVALDLALSPPPSSALFALALLVAAVAGALVLVFPGRGRARFVARALLALLAVVLALPIGELAARRVFPRAPHGIVAVDGSAAASPYRPDPVLGHAPLPGFRGRFVHPEYGGESYLANADGFRDREWPASWPADEERVLLLGDSMAVGFGVELEESLAARIERGLLEAEPARSLRVLNAGVAGYGARHERELLRRLLPRTRPTTVVCVFYDGNDLGDAREHLVRTGQTQRVATSAEEPPPEPEPTLFERVYWSRYSQLFACIEARVARLFPRLGMPPPIHGYHDLPRLTRLEFDAHVHEEAQLTIEALSGMRDLCREAGARFVVARVPSRAQAEPELFERMLVERGLDPSAHDRARPGADVLAACRAQGIEAIDLLPALDWRGEGPNPCFFLEGHLAREGIERAARVIALRLRSEP